MSNCCLFQDEGVLGSPTTLLDNPGVAELELNSISLSDTAEYSCIASYQGIGVITSQAKPVFVRGDTSDLFVLLDVRLLTYLFC